MAALFERIFQDTGKRFKLLATACFYIILIAGVMAIFMLLVSGGGSARYMYYVLLCTVLTPLCAFLVPLPLYAIGTALESIEREEELMCYTLLELFETRYKNGEITEQEYRTRLDIIKNR